MDFIGIIHNLALLIVLSVVSGFIAQRLKHQKHLAIVQGIVFGAVAVTGMMYPVVMSPGLIFDGRSVVISLCGLFFGPVAAGIAGAMAIACRIYQAGPGTNMGVCVVLASAALGTIFHYRWVHRKVNLTLWHFSLLGILVHIAMLLATRALPPDIKNVTLGHIWLPVMVIYPIATVIIGKVLTDQESRSQYIEELARSQEKFKAIADYTVDWESWFAPDGSYYWVNPEVKSFTGYSAEEILAMPDPAGTLVYEEDLGRFFETFMQALEGSSGKDFEFRYKHRDGSVRWLTSSWRRIYGSDGNYLGIRTSSRDITERKKSEEALRLSEDKFAKTFYLSPDAININRLTDGCYLDINQGFTMITGYTKEEVIGRSSLPGDLGIWVNAQDRDRLIQGIREKGEVIGLEAQFRKKDGSILIGMMSARIVDIEGVECLLTVTRDITERHLAEKEKRRFYRDTILSVTQGKLDLATLEEVNDYLNNAEQMLKAEHIQDISSTRHQIVKYLKDRGLDHDKVMMFESAIGEAITNAIKHATDCRVYMGVRDGIAWVGVADSGPGISNIMLPGATLRRGFSSKVSMGMGYSIMMEESDSIMLCTGPEGTIVILFMKISANRNGVSLDELPDTWGEIHTS